MIIQAYPSICKAGKLENNQCMEISGLVVSKEFGISCILCIDRTFD